MRLMLSLLALLAFSVKAEQIWLDDDWDITSQDQASFYLAQPLAQQGALWQGTVFYKSTGNKRFEGSFTGPDMDSNHSLGPYKFYHPNGQLQAEGRRDDQGNFVGPTKIYGEDGVLESERLYQMPGQWVSEITYFYDNGQARQHSHYNKAGRLDGLRQAFYPGGQLESEQPYQNGQLDGLARSWAESGTLTESSPYQKGKRHGQTLEYDKDGKLTRSGNYRQGDKVGEHRWLRPDGSNSRLDQYDKKGRLLSRTDFDKDGNKTQERSSTYLAAGTQSLERYYSRGKLTRQVSKGPEDGRYLMERYDAKGELTDRQQEIDNQLHGLQITSGWGGQTTRLEYRQGQRHGDYSRTGDKGELLEQGRYENDQKVGTWRYQQRGLLVEHYLAGQLDGERRQTSEDGQLLLLEHYRLGKLHGLVEEYDRQGHLQTQGRMVNGQHDGPWHLKDDGYLLRYLDGTFKMGKKVGTWRTSNGKGYLVGQGQYDNQGRQQGVFYSFDDQGLLTELATYKDGQLHGANRHYRDGVQVYQADYRQGELLQEKEGDQAPCSGGGCSLFDQ
ncbi:toxin-antitoxin system YwqK family antitoxin [Gallaecimonas xiamenensis]|nr:toxin-antitoxin system YwqK family antitoxin [Gallaecimonas xiamenensis]